MSAIKFEAARIHFLSEVFLAVAVVVASTPQFLCPSAYRAVHLTLAHRGNQPTRVSTYRRESACLKGKFPYSRSKRCPPSISVHPTVVFSAYRCAHAKTGSPVNRVTIFQNHDIDLMVKSSKAYMADETEWQYEH